MKERSIFSYYWFWLLIVGVLLILLAAILHLGLKENTNWVWWIFVVGAVLAVLGIILSVVSYYNEPACVVEPVESADFDCDDIMNSSPQYNTTIPISKTAELSSPIYSPIGTPSKSTLNLPQVQRGFTTTGSELSSLAPPKF